MRTEKSRDVGPHLLCRTGRERTPFEHLIGRGLLLCPWCSEVLVDRAHPLPVRQVRLPR